MFSFTLQVKTEGYKRSRNTRVYLCASSPDESGSEALEWCLEALVQDGDELIIFRGVDEDVFEKDHNVVRDEAREFMRTVQERSVEYDSNRKISLILEYIPGKITDSIDRLIALYRPDSVVVGTRGRRFGASLVQGFGVGLPAIGSISKYCLAHSPVPVIVVRPGRKLRKDAEKRRADPKRGKHFETI
jgi:nucleotide-binding universal stress UspA family protein